MNFANIPLFNIMKAQLSYASGRQAVLAQNIANADTPDYKAMDVTAPDFKKMAAEAGSGPGKPLRMAVTNPKHMGHGASAAGDLKVEKRKATDELNPNGNNVVIEEEMSKVAANQADYQKALNLYAKTIGMFKTAVGSGGGG